MVFNNVLTTCSVVVYSLLACAGMHAHSLANGGRRDIQFPTSGKSAHLLPADIYKNYLASIVGLLKTAGPSTIIFRVTFVIIDSLKSHVLWGASHIGIKIG